MEKKKHLIVLVLKLLETESDAQHPITQTYIADTISKVYSCDRKTVGRNINCLIEMGYPVVKTTTGFYMDKKAFTLKEIEFVRNSIISANNIPGLDNTQLSEKVVECLFEKYSK